MYKLLRNLHLAAGLFAALFLVLYGLSAAQMATPYQPRSVQETRTIDVPIGVETEARPLARWLMDAHGLDGELTQVESGDTRTVLTVVRPGTTHEITYQAGSRRATIVTDRSGTIGLLNRLHHVAGFKHAHWPTRLWAMLLFVVSLLLLVLSTTGVTLWFQRHRERRSGAIVLAVGLTWGLSLLILIRAS